MLALLAAYLVFGEFDESDPAQNGSGADSSTASQTADENNGLSENGETQLARIGHRLARLYQIMQENRRRVDEERQELQTDRKSTRLNSSHAT